VKVVANALTTAAAAGSNKPLTGASGPGMVVGSLPTGGIFRTFADFINPVPPSGRPVKDELDVKAAGAFFAGSCSRFSQP
jgi:hypothetical protein